MYIYIYIFTHVYFYFIYLIYILYIRMGSIIYRIQFISDYLSSHISIMITII